MFKNIKYLWCIKPILRDPYKDFYMSIDIDIMFSHVKIIELCYEAESFNPCDKCYIIKARGVLIYVLLEAVH